MIKFLSTLILLIVSCNLSFAYSSARPNTVIDNLKGSVKSVKTYTFKKQKYYHSDTITKYKKLNMPLPQYSKELYSEDHYNLQGRKTYCINWFIDHYTFDPNNDKTSWFKTQTSYNKDGSLRRIYDFSFDSNWFPVSAIATDEKGDLIFTESYSTTTLPDGKIEINCIHTLSDGESSESSLLLRPDLSMAKLIQNSPDYYQEIDMDENEQPYRIYTKRNGNETELTMENISNIQNTYKKDRLGKQGLIMTVVYDANGNIISETRYNADGEVNMVRTYTYTYDPNGNWVRREVTTDSNSDPEIHERVIEYY